MHLSLAILYVQFKARAWVLINSQWFINQNLNESSVVSSGKIPDATFNKLTRVSRYRLKLLIMYSSWFVMGALKKKER